jgi:hypothetical protein
MLIGTPTQLLNTHDRAEKILEMAQNWHFCIKIPSIGSALNQNFIKMPNQRGKNVVYPKFLRIQWQHGNFFSEN